MRPHLQVVEGDLEEPPYPADTRAGGWRFDLDVERIKHCDTWVLAPPDMRPWLLMLWMESWAQSPCGSLPNDDALIAAHIGMEPRPFAANRDILLRRWVLHADGRLYHHFITEKVLAMLDARGLNRRRQARFRDGSVTRYARVTNAAVTRESRTDSSSTGTDPLSYERGVGVARARAHEPAEGASAFRPPPTPTQQVIDLYNTKLPELQRADVTDASRKRAIAARWRAVCTQERFNREQGLAWFAWFFDHVRESPFLLGAEPGRRDGTPFATCNLDWLLDETHFTRVIEGVYHRRSRTATG